jgi:hypothetical protein
MGSLAFGDGYQTERVFQGPCLFEPGDYVARPPPEDSDAIDCINRGM